LGDDFSFDGEAAGVEKNDREHHDDETSLSHPSMVTWCCA
jgi:hypothetical protein